MDGIKGKEVVNLCQKYGNQKKAAEELGITQQAISDALKQARWRALSRAEDLLQSTLEDTANYK